MNNDIVALLREQVDDEFLSYCNVLEAANEIERLREELKDARHMFLRLAHIFTPSVGLLSNKDFLELGKLLKEFEAQ